MASGIFDLLNKQENTIFSSLNKQDLKLILELINSYYIDYRDTLGFPSDYSFGPEIEFDKCGIINMTEKISLANLQYDYKVVTDDSVKKGGEIKTPIMYDTVDMWKYYKELCLAVRRNAEITSNCGGHIHAGFHLITSKEEFINLLKL